MCRSLRRPHASRRVPTCKVLESQWPGPGAQHPNAPLLGAQRAPHHDWALPLAHLHLQPMVLPSGQHCCRSLPEKAETLRVHACRPWSRQARPSPSGKAGEWGPSRAAETQALQHKGTKRGLRTKKKSNARDLSRSAGAPRGRALGDAVHRSGLPGRAQPALKGRRAWPRVCRLTCRALASRLSHRRCPCSACTAARAASWEV